MGLKSSSGRPSEHLALTALYLRFVLRWEIHLIQDDPYIVWARLSALTDKYRQRQITPQESTGLNRSDHLLLSRFHVDVEPLRFVRKVRVRWYLQINLGSKLIEMRFELSLRNNPGFVDKRPFQGSLA